MTDLRTDAQRKASTDVLEKVTDQFKAQGWSVERKSVGDGTCLVGAPPPKNKTVTVAVTCLAKAKGSALSLAAVLASATVTPEKLKALLDKAVSRLP